MELIAKQELVETPAAHIEAPKPSSARYGAIVRRATARSCTWFGIGFESDSTVYLRAAYVAKPHHGP
jgi:hypothetical protein